MTEKQLPESVDQARIAGGVARCDCGFSIRFDGDENTDQAKSIWWSDEHQSNHFGGGDGG